MIYTHVLNQGRPCSGTKRPRMKRAILIDLGLLAAFVVALLFVPRLRDARLTLGAIFVRLGVVMGLDRENVEFHSGGSTLSGTIVFSEESPPRAAIVLIHGSGRATRMLWLAHLFASEGIAVLTYDKRGVGKSGGQFVGGLSARSAANFDLLAQDAAAGAAVISHHPRLRGAPVGYVGLSQGGWIAPIAATRPPVVSFMAFFSGPVTTVSEEGHFSSLAESDSTFWKTHTRQQIAEYMKSVSYPPDDVDPRSTLSQLHIPAFWAFGGQDNAMPVDLSVTRLEELIARGQSQFRYKIYPEYGHELIVFDLSRVSLSNPFREGVDWIMKTAGGAVQQGAAAVGRY